MNDIDEALVGEQIEHRVAGPVTVDHPAATIDTPIPSVGRRSDLA